ncbi:MAG: Flp pilus assembly complex ATPase component TadA [Candidatus Nomurabacteria bacterium]|nr:MAG: Flp pilus assembly complex ATPase component TadA [Candidatus Nomurabacteria bacterium]
MIFLEELVRRQIITEPQVSEVLRISEEKFGGDVDKAMVEMGIDEKLVAKAKSEVYGVPYKEINPKQVSTNIAKYIPEDSARHYRFVPIGVTDGVLEVGILNPDNIEATDALQFISTSVNMPFRLFVITYSEYEKIFDIYKGLSGEVDTALSELDSEIKEANVDDVIIEKGKKQLSKEEEEKIVEEAPIIKIVAVIIKYAVEGNASDIHIENTGEKVNVRFRIDGILHTSITLPPTTSSGVVARIKILSKLRLDEKRKPQDGSFSTKIEGRKIDFRVSTFPTQNGEKVVMRILDSEKGVKPLSELGLSERNYKMVKEALSRPYGLILITGPTGSGKSTTLYSMLKELNREESNVVSLEDPVEYRIDGVSQSQVMPEIGYTFASGLRSILRQDPDIIFVGEIRDKETAQLAIQAALTGHLVLSTLHTNSAIGVVPRLVDMGIDPYLIAPTLVLSIAQRLARTICDGGAKKIDIDESMKLMIDKQFEDLPKEHKDKIPLGGSLYDAVPTPDCPSGIKGRMAVFEMYEVDKEMEKLILSNPVEPEIYKLARSKGMLTMYEDALIKSAEGKIPYKETYNFATN